MADAAKTAAENNPNPGALDKLITYPSQQSLIAARKAPEAGFVAGA
jgi:hypothetical protein